MQKGNIRGFIKKIWKDAIEEFPNRRTITDVSSGQTQTVTVTRSTGVISQEGDAWSAENMNDMEDRVSDAIDEIEEQFEPMTEAEYNAITTKENRLYFIK